MRRTAALPDLDPIDELLDEAKAIALVLRHRGAGDWAQSLLQHVGAAATALDHDRRVWADAQEKLEREGYEPCTACGYWTKAEKMEQRDDDQLYCGCDRVHEEDDPNE